MQILNEVSERIPGEIYEELISEKACLRNACLSLGISLKKTVKETLGYFLNEVLK